MASFTSQSTMLQHQFFDKNGRRWPPLFSLDAQTAAPTLTTSATPMQHRRPSETTLTHTSSPSGAMSPHSNNGTAGSTSTTNGATSQSVAGVKRSHSPPQEDSHLAGDNASADHENSAGGRQRSRAACVPCRTRKRKCDGRHPCATCVRYEYQCEYSHGKKPSISHQQSADAPAEPAPQMPVGNTPSSIIQLQAHPLTAPGARFHHRSILDPVKTRFVRANSAIAFPRILGMDFESESIPRLHSFAWHVGIRQEPRHRHIDITSLISWQEFQVYASVYFRTIRVEIGILEETEFTELAHARFLDPSGYKDIDAVCLGVASLGSFFSQNPHPREQEMIDDAQLLLVQRSVEKSPSINNVVGWILRTIYLRLTGRPHASWLTSSITMHQIEANGLHKEMQTIAVVYPAAPTADHKLAKLRRRLFWIARALNVIFSFDFGRLRTNFDVVTTKKFAPDHNGFAHQFVELAELLPNDNVDREREPDPPAALSQALTKIEELQSDSNFINLLKADLAFAIYRRLWLMSLTDAKDRTDTILALGQASLQASAKCLESRTPWWNVLHSPFQFILCCLAIGTPKALAFVHSGMAHLQTITRVYDTHMVREAYNQALAVVKMSRARKEKELEALDGLGDAPPFEDPPSAAASSVALTEAPNTDWAVDLPFEWDIFLNPDLVLHAAQGHSAVDASFGGTLGF